MLCRYEAGVWSAEHHRDTKSLGGPNHHISANGPLLQVRETVADREILLHGDVGRRIAENRQTPLVLQSKLSAVQRSQTLVEKL